MGLDIVEMFVEVESAFGIEIPDAMAPYLSTVGALYDFVATHVEPTPASVRPGLYVGELWERYLDVIENDTGVSRASLRPTARFVQDLGLD
jgi:hypothetical protein